MTISDIAPLVFEWFITHDSLSISQFDELLKKQPADELSSACVLGALEQYCALDVLRKVDVNQEKKNPKYVWVLLKPITQLTHNIQISGTRCLQIAGFINEQLTKFGINDPEEKANPFSIKDDDIRRLLIISSNLSVALDKIKTPEPNKEK